MLVEELDATKKQLEKLLKQHEELEMKSKSDIKVLVKEIKSLRSSQTQMKQELSRSLKEKSETEVGCFSLDAYGTWSRMSFLTIACKYQFHHLEPRIISMNSKNKLTRLKLLINSFRFFLNHYIIRTYLSFSTTWASWLHPFIQFSDIERKSLTSIFFFYSLLVDWFT